MYHSISPSLISLKLMGVLYHSMKSTEYPLILKSPITCFLGESHKSSDQMVMSTCYWVHSAIRCKQKNCALKQRSIPFKVRSTDENHVKLYRVGHQIMPMYGVVTGISTNCVVTS